MPMDLLSPELPDLICSIYSEMAMKVPAFTFPPSRHRGLSDNGWQWLPVLRRWMCWASGGCRRWEAAGCVVIPSLFLVDKKWQPKMHKNDMWKAEVPRMQRDRGLIPTLLLGQDWDTTAHVLPVAKQTFHFHTCQRRKVIHFSVVYMLIYDWRLFLAYVFPWAKRICLTTSHSQPQNLLGRRMIKAVLPPPRVNLSKTFLNPGAQRAACLTSAGYIALAKPVLDRLGYLL